MNPRRSITLRSRLGGRLPMVLLVLAAIAALVAGWDAVAGQERETATGIVLRVESAGPADVQAFQLRTAEGGVLTFRVGRLDTSGGGFPAAHLREHLATAERIRVTFTRDGEGLTALHLVDAP